MNRLAASIFAVGIGLAISASVASAQQVGGAIAQKWWEIGSENSVVGRPTSNEITVPGGGRVSCFERGAIAWHPQSGAWPLHGDIYLASVFGEICRRGNADHQIELEPGVGAIGFPVGDEYVSSGGWWDLGCPKGHRIQKFIGAISTGALCWSPSDRKVSYVGDQPNLF